MHSITFKDNKRCDHVYGGGGRQAGEAAFLEGHSTWICRDAHSRPCSAHNPGALWPGLPAASTWLQAGPLRPLCVACYFRRRPSSRRFRPRPPGPDPQSVTSRLLCVRASQRVCVCNHTCERCTLVSWRCHTSPHAGRLGMPGVSSLCSRANARTKVSRGRAPSAGSGEGPSCLVQLLRLPHFLLSPQPRLSGPVRRWGCSGEQSQAGPAHIRPHHGDVRGRGSRAVRPASGQRGGWPGPSGRLSIPATS